jgi:hypothetical protein
LYLWAEDLAESHVPEVQGCLVGDGCADPVRSGGDGGAHSNTLARREYKGKFISRILVKNPCRIRHKIRIRDQLKSRIRIRIRKKSFQIHNTGHERDQKPKIWRTVGKIRYNRPPLRIYIISLGTTVK